MFLNFVIGWTNENILTPKISRITVCLSQIYCIICVLSLVVFMGSEKYKGENTFESFISKHGGYSNASTEYEKVRRDCRKRRRREGGGWGRGRGGGVRWGRGREGGDEGGGGRGREGGDEGGGGRGREGMREVGGD